MSANDPKRTLICCGRRFKALSIRPLMHLLGLRLDYPCNRVIVQPEFAKIAPLRSRVKRTRRVHGRLIPATLLARLSESVMKHMIFSRRSTARSPKGFDHQKHRRLDRCRSARTPAHYCGAYAHKPTLNDVPPRGHTIPSTTPREADLAMVGPMARSAG
jgi:hypothetical protein